MKREIIFLMWAIVILLIIAGCRPNSGFKDSGSKDSNSEEQNDTTHQNDTANKSVVIGFTKLLKDSFDNKLSGLSAAKDSLQDKTKNLESRIEKIEENKAKYFWSLVIVAFLGFCGLVYALYVGQRVSAMDDGVIHDIKEMDQRLRMLENHKRNDNIKGQGYISSASEICTIRDSLKWLEQRIETLESHGNVDLTVHQRMPEPQQQQKQITEAYVGEVKGVDIGYFTDVTPSMTNDSCYHLFNIKGNYADFEAIDFKSINGSNQATKAAVFSGTDKKDANDIKSQKAGNVRKSSDGYWEVCEKVRIELM